MGKPKILLFDVETTPIGGWTWTMYEADVLRVDKPSHFLCFAYKWLDEKVIKAHALPDYKTYLKDKEDDRELCQELWHVLDRADIVIAHNGQAFDVKKSMERFLYHDLGAPSPFQHIDTLTTARKHFKMGSNKLDAIGRHLGLGRKLKHTGIDLWFDCMAGDEKAWKMMVRYNKQDVKLLEDVYYRLRPFMTSHPNVNVLSNKPEACPLCGENALQRRGFVFTRVSKRQRYQCTKCGGWSSGKSGQKALDIR